MNFYQKRVYYMFGDNLHNIRKLNRYERKKE